MQLKDVYFDNTSTTPWKIHEVMEQPVTQTPSITILHVVNGWVLMLPSGERYVFSDIHKLAAELPAIFVREKLTP